MHCTTQGWHPAARRRTLGEGLTASTPTSPAPATHALNKQEHLQELTFTFDDVCCRGDRVAVYRTASVVTKVSDQELSFVNALDANLNLRHFACFTCSGGQATCTSMCSSMRGAH